MFVHLRLHSEFSVVDGTNRIDDVVASAATDGQPALALTDLNNLFGAIKFYETTRKAGIKPIIGTEIIIEPASGSLSDKDAFSNRIVLLAQNKQGYLNLCELLTRAWMDVQVKTQTHAVVRWKWLKELSDGLIALSGGIAGAIGQSLAQDDQIRAQDAAVQLAQIFPNRFYLELQRAARVGDEALVAATVKLAKDLKLPVVATHPIQFATTDDFQAHEARVCIADGEILANQKRVQRFTPDQYFKTAAQMTQLFADIPSAIANTFEIAKRCNITLTLGKAYLPEFPIPAGYTIETYLRHVTQEGLEARLAHLYPDPTVREQQRHRYQQRLDFELDTIIAMGFPGYFLIVSDFINWARTHGCPVGPGRGSGAGSLVAYALKITDLDPLHYKLLFERFLNPERVSMPDFDIDFCQVNRDRVIEYVKDKYGRAAVSQIATFGSMAARASIRDVGRVLDMSYTFCDSISKLIPNKPGIHITIADAIKQEPLLAERIEKEEEARNLIALAQKLEGLTRNIGMHAGGVLIAPGKLTDFCPLYQQPGSNAAVSQYDKGDVETVGLVKFDFLGLATLTILELAKEFIISRYPEQKDFAYENIPLNDRDTYRLFQEGQTEAVFQFESRGMQGMLRDAKPTRLEDLIALNALYRPGPMDLIPSFTARKHGREQVEYPHPLVADMLSETYGIMVYQEQVMQTAQILGGYSLGGADLLRRAMGKKKVEEMAKHREIFRDGAAKNGIRAEKANEIFDLMEKFAGYGFNKSHAAAYSLLAYHTAWLKVHYMAEFYCANMTVEIDDTDKLKVLFEDAQRQGIRFEPPDINQSGYRFEPISDKRIRYSLGAVKGPGELAIAAIVAARESGGPFKSLFDFCVRVDRQRVNKRTIDALIRAGAFDCISTHRAQLLAAVDLATEFASVNQANAHQGGLFDMMEDSHGASTQEPELPDIARWSLKEQLSQEKTAIGFYLSGHLFDIYKQEVSRFKNKAIGELENSREPQTIAGIISELRFVNGQRGKLAYFKIDDGSGIIEARAEENVYMHFRNALKDDELIIVTGKALTDRFSGGMQISAHSLLDLPTARCRYGKFLYLVVGSERPNIRGLLEQFPARVESTEQGQLIRGLPIRLAVMRSAVERNDFDVKAATAQIALGEKARFFPTDEALASLVAQAESGQATIMYEEPSTV